MLLALAAPTAQAEPVQTPQAPSSDLRNWVLEVSGGDVDDQAFARAALGWRSGDPLLPDALKMGLEAVKATDRFRNVEFQSLPGARGGTLKLILEPWPALEAWRWSPGAPPLKGLLPELKKGQRVGDLRLKRLQELAETRLKAAGFPQGQLTLKRLEGGRRLELNLNPGAPALVQSVVLEGRLEPYGETRLLKVLGVKPGKTRWTSGEAREVLGRMRSRFVSDKRFEWTADFAWEASQGILKVTVNPGPIVELRQVGDSLGWTNWWKRLGDLVPLARAERYSPEILDEGSRRMTRLLRDEGYLDAKVSHQRECLDGPPERPTKVRITYRVEAGPQFKLGQVRFERNREFEEGRLRQALELPRQWFGLRPAHASPEVVEAVDGQLRSFYWAQGFPDFTTRRRLEGPPGNSTLVFTLGEGSARRIRGLTLVVPRGIAWDGASLAESLALAVAQTPQFRTDPDGARTVVADRPHLGPLKAVLREEPYQPGQEGRVFRLLLGAPIPLVKTHLAEVLGSLRHRLASLGAQQPLDRLTVSPGEDGVEVRIDVPIQPLGRVQRLVVQGADRTRARAILREAELDRGLAMDPDRLLRAQARLANLEAFQRVDLDDLGQSEEFTPGTWREGDLRLRLEERVPWVFSSGFGYDKAQGYHFSLGAQRLNLGGMGRTLDFGLRAGDGTIDNPTLRKWFPTGQDPRSVDSFSVGLTDPWFAPGFLQGVLSPRTQFRIEGAYVEERRSVYLLHRRRVIESLEWKPGMGYLIQAGHRFERVETQAASENIQDDVLATLARYPKRSIISAPFVQVVRDTRDNPLDPTRGQFGVARLEFANQVFGTSPNASFVKVDLRQQWNWSFGALARGGILSLGLRAGLARPTAPSANDLPLSERFFAGGPGSHRGVEPDGLGPQGQVPLLQLPGLDYVLDENGNRKFRNLALGGQALALASLEYRFPLIGRFVWGEVFVDSGQVYAAAVESPSGSALKFPPLRTAAGLGIILKVGVPFKFEYAADIRRLMGWPRSQQDRDTQLKTLLISAGFQF